jgi:ParB family chromosome partitioning protein
MDKTRAEHLPIEKLRPFEGHPFKVADNEEMDQLVESIMTQGVLTPLVVRPLANGEYEVISGHRRLHACKKAGIEAVPALIMDIDRDAATIALVDSNLHREHILPSEKAFAFKMKRDALNRQGTSRQVGEKLSVTQISESTGDSERQVHRYIRLTNLIPGILQMVDDGRIALTPAVEISYLTNREQRELLETMECEDCTPSLSQAIQLKLLSQSGNLDIYTIFDILTQRKPNQQEKISFRTEDVRKFFPKSYTTAQMQDVILRLLEGYQRQRQRSQER